MSVSYIYKFAGPKIGLNPSNANERLVLQRFLNEAAYEIWNQFDPAGSLMELSMKVNGDQTISLPSYVGELRAVREFSSQIPWSINQMRPRYNQSNWNDFWRNFRLRNKQALAKTITNTAAPIVYVSQVDNPPLVVSISGRTSTAQSISEQIPLTSTGGVSAVNNYIDIVGFTKTLPTTYDVTLNDVDGNLISSIQSNELEASFQIVDVSTCPWLQNSGSERDHYLEILFKKRLPYLSYDADEFPAQGFDIILANKMCQIWAQEQGNSEKALAYDQLNSRSLARRQEEANRATEDVIALVENPHDNLNPRIRARRPGRYSGYGTSNRYGLY